MVRADDTIQGQGGDDHIYADSGFNLDLSTRLDLATQVLLVTSVPSASDHLPTHDDLTVGSDDISGGDGDDIILADHGSITQISGTQRIQTTGNVIQVQTALAASGGDDLVFGDAGEDAIMGGFGDDVLFGDADDDVIVGDSGRIDVVDDAVTSLVIASTDPSLGGDDVIEGNGGDDDIIAGFGADIVSGGSGDDSIVGDSGRIDFTAAGPVFTLGSASTDPSLGGDDVIEGNDGDDDIIAGFGADIVSGGSGDDRIVGDSGRIEWAAGTVITLGIASTAPNLGGDDVIEGNDGDDIIIGGFGADAISGGNGNDIIIADNGEVLLSGGDFYLIRSLDNAIGGDDTVSGNDGNDYIIGGAGGDTLFGDSQNDPSDTGNDILIGDNGEFYSLRTGESLVLKNSGQVYTGDGDPTTLDVVWNVDPAIGGNDTIDGGNGDDVLLGGAGDDLLLGNFGDDTLVGDDGQIVFDLNRIRTIETIIYSTLTFGGDDILAGFQDNLSGLDGDDHDVMLGGFGDDTFYGNFSTDVMIGEYGRLTYEYLGDSTESLGLFFVRLGQNTLDLIANQQFGLYSPVPLDVGFGQIGGIIPVGGASQASVLGREAHPSGDDRSHGGRPITSADLAARLAAIQPAAGEAFTVPVDGQCGVGEEALMFEGEAIDCIPHITPELHDLPLEAGQEGDTQQTDIHLAESLLGVAVAGFTGWRMASSERKGTGAAAVFERGGLEKLKENAQQRRFRSWNQAADLVAESKQTQSFAGFKVDWSE